MVANYALRYWKALQGFAYPAIRAYMSALINIPMVVKALILPWTISSNSPKMGGLLIAGFTNLQLFSHHGQTNSEFPCLEVVKTSQSLNFQHGKINTIVGMTKIWKNYTSTVNKNRNKRNKVKTFEQVNSESPPFPDRQNASRNVYPLKQCSTN